MSIFETLKDRESRKTFEQQNAVAFKLFDQQKGAVKAIKDSEGYLEIKRFFEAERKAALDRVMTAPKGDEAAKAMYLIAEKFLEFLSVREK